MVTFNAEQQRLIEDLLDRERADDPDLEWFFSEERLEPVMVKNLESVQGDERDVMLFSITYAPDQQGKLSMNFGPMNRDGGERRLNVAVTRAKRELVVFSTLRPEQIDLSRTRASGVRDLKHFLEFAARGPAALREADRGSVGGFESPFERAVANALTDKGWRVLPQIGVSAFRVDLGVVHPDEPGRFLAGVEADGATYHRSAIARDRDKLREQVLRGLGWSIVRVWSTDWWIDTEGALERLHGKLEALLEADRAEAARRAAEQAAAAEAAPPALDVPDDDVAVPSAATEDFLIPPRRPSNDAAARAEPLYADRPSGPRPSAPAAEARELFRFADPASVATPEPENFFEESYRPTLRAMLAHVIETEGPVREDVLAARVARAHGFARTGSKIRKALLDIAEGEWLAKPEAAGRFFWPSDQNATQRFRPAASPRDRRPADEIAAAELAALAREVREGGAGDVVAAMARKLELGRLTATTRARLEEVAAQAED